MRFSLSQLYVCTPNVVEAYRVETIEQEMPMKNAQKDGDDFVIPSCQQKHKTVRGMFLHQAKEPTEHIIFWIYGGAYLSGDVLGIRVLPTGCASKPKWMYLCPTFGWLPKAI